MAKPRVYGDRRDYRKIDIYLDTRAGLTYLKSTTWARNCREARERYCEAADPRWAPRPADLKAYYAKR